MIVTGHLTVADKPQPLSHGTVRLSRVTIYARHENHGDVFIGNIASVTNGAAYNLAPNHEVTLVNVMPVEVWIAANDEESQRGDTITWIGS